MEAQKLNKRFGKNQRRNSKRSKKRLIKAQQQQEANAILQTLPTSGIEHFQKGAPVELPNFQFDLQLSNLNLVASNADLNYLRSKLRSAVIIGLDTETAPQFQKGQPPRPVQLLQMALRHQDGFEEVFIIDLWKVSWQQLDSCLDAVFKSTQILKIGRAFIGDLKELNMWFPQNRCFIGIQGYLDICDLNRAIFPGDRPEVSLRLLTNVHLQLNLSKAQQKSNWGRRPLTQAQIHYAACDALVLLRLYDNFISLVSVCHEQKRGAGFSKEAIICPHCSEFLKSSFQQWGFVLCNHAQQCTGLIKERECRTEVPPGKKRKRV